MSFKIDLRRAVKFGDLELVRKYFEPEDLNCNGYSGNQSLLHYAAIWGTLEVVKFLVGQGAEVSRRAGTYNAPALTYAADKGRVDVVRYLVEVGSLIDMSHALTNPLLRAADEGHYDVVEYFLSTNIDHHASYRVPPGTLINALTEAKQGKHQEVAGLLKSHGCHRPVEGVDIPLWEPPADKMSKRTPVPQKDQEIIQYMEQRFGPADKNAIQELIPVMEGISVTINVIPPNEVHPFFVLFTNGMSDLPMKVSPGQEAWQYAELVMHLPADWVHPRDASGESEWMWPFQWLRKMAYYPHLNDTSLGRPAAIVSSDDPPTPLGPNTEQTCLLMIPDFSNLDPPLQRSNSSLIHFFTVVPLYTEERDFELEHGMRVFFERFAEHQVPMTVAPSRPSFV
ncbi:Ankyrin repeat-containing protein [Neorhodopirellula lusitana]|uniref:Ankyrin repeat-containing protein n=1 Tax=Neorhodopirellula lusitana TaxID=445327 RepID=A0ABY1QGM0_9BACT|nr:suppressor of fused domain protein [Neorhodopirellula lusitana]SMP70718.1 Ankyrin repeat-containing protein [Neorhodopirellula lusitana]